MTFSRFLPAAALAPLAFALTVQAVPVDTSFTYQGELTESGQPVDGVTCDFRFGLWDADSGGSEVGGSPIARSANVVDGLFSTSLDFGTAFDAGEKRWLEIEIQCPGDASFTALTPRTEVKGAPQAQYAITAGQANSVAWADVSGIPADIADGDDVNDADASTTNEIQNLFATVAGNSGSTTANTSTDTVSIVGSGSISTSVSGDTVTISSSSGGTGQIVGGGSAFSADDNGPNFLPMAASGRTTSYDGVKTRVPIAGTITDFAGMLQRNLVGASYTFTVMKNGADTSITCGISGTSSVICTDTTNCASFASGDEIAVRAPGSGGDNSDNMIIRWDGIFTAGGTCP